MDIIDAMYSLLTSEEAVHPDNMIFKDQNPFSKPENPDNWTLEHVFEDINDGAVWYKAYHIYIHDKEKDVLCPIIFLFINKTFLDRNSQLQLEPVKMTLGIFNKEAWCKPSAWHTIGYIVNQSNISATKSISALCDVSVCP